MNKVKNKNIIIFSIILIVITSTAFINKNIDTIIYNTKKETNDENSIYFNIIDMYDRPNQKTYEELFENKNSLINLKKMNEDLNKNFEFIEITMQPLQMLEYYNGENKFIYSNQHNSPNKEIEIKGEKKYITNLKAIQINNNNSISFGNYIESGRYFEDNDFNKNLKDNIEVILGYEYKQHYKLGDTITLNYIEKDVQLEVIGFLNKNTTIKIKNRDILLDEYICMPHFNIENSPTSKEEELFQKRYYLQKNNGYIKTNEIEMLEKYKNKIEEISIQNNLEYSILQSAIDIEINNNEY